MKLYDRKKDPKIILVVSILLTYIVTIFLLSVSVRSLSGKLGDVSNELIGIKSTQSNFEKNFSEELFSEHLELSSKRKIENELAVLKSELETLKANEDTTTVEINKIFDLLESFEQKVARNDKVKIDSENIEEKTQEWGLLLINKDFTSIQKQITESNTQLDTDYNKYLASLPPPAPIGGGYSYTTVDTERGRYGVYLVKLPLSEYRVKTVTAARDDCSDNCPTKSLADYVKENNGVVGMNGSYFCPPDYSNCSGKTNTFDYALYDSNARKWINKDARSWGDTGLMTFNGNSARFYKRSSDYNGDGVDAAISNYPSLLEDGDIVVDEDILTSYQKDVKGTRGAIGFGGENIYLALILGATVEDAAYAMRALGAKDALNLDGGGSSAMYSNGGYIVGPGRSLPNAIVLVKN